MDGFSYIFDVIGEIKNSWKIVIFLVCTKRYKNKQTDTKEDYYSLSSDFLRYKKTLSFKLFFNLLQKTLKVSTKVYATYY